MKVGCNHHVFSWHISLQQGLEVEVHLSANGKETSSCKNLILDFYKCRQKTLSKENGH
jgi:hypothetical protein